MIVDVIEDRARFEALRTEWNAAYLADPEAQFFLSWTFVSMAIDRVGTGWRVLAVRPAPSAPYVAFFPLRISAYLSKRHQTFCNIVELPGRALWADYCGFVCASSYDTQAIGALGARLREMPWAQLDLEHWLVSDERARLFLAGFEATTFGIVSTDRGPGQDGVDNDVCPIVALPDSFETFATERMSANTRQKMRRFLRKLDAGDELRITETTADTLERDLDILLTFWIRTWAHRKLDIEQKAQKFKYLLTEAHRRGVLHLPVLWRGTQPVAAMGYFLDPPKKAVLFKVAGRHDSCTDLPPGLILHAHMIRWAIRHGYRTYDFMRGNEPYKYSYGPTERRLRNLTIRTHSRRNLHGRLDPLAVSAVKEQADGYRRRGQIARAEVGYRQIAEIEQSIVSSRG